MIILQISSFAGYLEKYSNRLSVPLYLFLNSTIIFFGKILVWSKSHYMVEIAVLSQEYSKYDNVANNKCIQKRTVLVLLII